MLNVLLSLSVGKGRKLVQFNLKSESVWTMGSDYRNEITGQMVCMGRLSGGIDTCQVT